MAKHGKPERARLVVPGHISLWMRHAAVSVATSRSVSSAECCEAAAPATAAPLLEALPPTVLPSPGELNLFMRGNLSFSVAASADVCEATALATAASLLEALPATVLPSLGELNPFMRGSLSSSSRKGLIWDE